MSLLPPQALSAVIATRTPASGHIYLTVLFISYLLGALPTSYLLAKWIMGLDLREHGSGNSGATNASRFLGLRYFFLIVLLDVTKAFGAMWLVKTVLPEMTLVGQLYCAGLFLLGNAFSIFIGFRGGKGVASGLGLLLYFLPAHLVMVYAAVFLIARVIGRRGDVAALCAVAVGAAWVQVQIGLPVEVMTASLIFAAWIWARHWQNILYLMGYYSLER